MERLTQHTPNGASLILDNPGNADEARQQVTAKFMLACNRLAAYEDTGLSPEEVALYVKCQAQSVSRRELQLGREIERLHAQLAEAQKRADNMAAQLTEAQRRAEPENKPLTLEELRQMKGEPVFVAGPGAEKYGHWVIVADVDTEAGEKVLFCKDDFTCRQYGKTWIAYRYKPKEAQHD